METKAIFERKITLTPRELNKVSKTRPIDALILEKVKQDLEGKCSQHGWVIPQSLKLLSRSLCHCEAGRFTGAMASWVQAEGNVYYPVDGMELEAEVLKKNKMGMFVLFNDAIQVMVPRDLHLENEEYHGVGIGDVIKVEIKKSRFQVNDPFILSVGVFKGIVRKASAAVAEEAPAVVQPETITEVEEVEEEEGEVEGAEEEDVDEGGEEGELEEAEEEEVEVE